MTKTIILRNNVRVVLSQYFDNYLTIKYNVYDIDCGNKPCGSMLNGKVKKLIGVDVEDGFYGSDQINVFGSAYDVPIDCVGAGAVISSKVLEHLE